MIGYASNTGTLRNLEALRLRHWRILLTPANPKPAARLRFAIDNGAWTAHRQGTAFDGDGFMRLVEPHGGQADFVVAPDIVAGGLRSLDFTLTWLDRLRTINLVLLALQDGMEAAHVGPVLKAHPALGLFLGGTTEWKLSTMLGWGMVAAAFGRHYHVGRVNTARRIRLCAEAGADSFDGTSCTMYAESLPLLDEARKQPSLLAALRYQD